MIFVQHARCFSIIGCWYRLYGKYESKILSQSFKISNTCFVFWGMYNKNNKIELGLVTDVNMILD